MKTLTICQPYAELIMRGQKLVENRTWATLYRGPLAIHAGKNREWLENDYPNWPHPERLVFGAVLGTVEIVACLKFDDIDLGNVPERFAHLSQHIHCFGPWCWVLENVKRFSEPIPARGAQGIWEWEEAVTT